MTTVARPSVTPSSTAADQPVPPPSVHLRALLTWIAVFAALTVAQRAIGPYVAGFPILLRTLVITGVVVPAVVYALVPSLLKVRAAVLPVSAPSKPANSAPSGRTCRLPHRSTGVAARSQRAVAGYRKLPNTVADPAPVKKDPAL